MQYEERLFSLQEDGTVTNATGYSLNRLDNDPNINFSTWNFDLSYSWQFAPGSFLTALYRNQLFHSDVMAMENFNNSFDTLFDQPIHHTFSIKVQYFLDYNQVPALLNNKKRKS